VLESVGILELGISELTLGSLIPEEVISLVVGSSLELVISLGSDDVFPDSNELVSFEEICD
jgi:hypothetical protein